MQSIKLKKIITTLEKRFKYIPFKVSKDTHQKGLVLKILKGSPGEKPKPKKGPYEI